MNSIGVFCGSNLGNKPIFREKAYSLGEELARRNIDLVYGGAKVGLMGAVADGALNKDGKVVGVLPLFLKEKELAHNELTEIIVVDTMHQRKQKMYELSDGIIALPGGFGTMDEMFEFLTWGQLALHQKPTGILNINNYYNPLLEFVDRSIEDGFVKEAYRNMFIVSENIDDLLNKMETYTPPVNDKWFVTK